MLKKIALITTLFFIALSCSKDDNSSDANPISANKQPTGSSSRDLLSNDTFKSMVIEIVYVEGLAPTQSTIDNFVTFLESRTFKPNGITVETRSIASPQNSPYSIQDAIEVEDANRLRYNNGDKIAIWIFFADQKSTNDNNESAVLGTAYRNTSLIVFEGTVDRFSNEPLGPSRNILETTVIEHEFGHILGLTNLGAPMQSNHEDIDHSKHCNVQNCLMYYAVETGSGIMGMVSGGTVPQLDSQCIADLQANGGK